MHIIRRFRSFNICQLLYNSRLFLRHAALIFQLHKVVSKINVARKVHLKKSCDKEVHALAAVRPQDRRLPHLERPILRIRVREVRRRRRLRRLLFRQVLLEVPLGRILLQLGIAGDSPFVAHRAVLARPARPVVAVALVLRGVAVLRAVQHVVLKPIVSIAQFKK